MAVEIEIYAKIIFGWVFGNHNSNLHHIFLIMDCMTLINQIPQVRMNHCFRKANKGTDVLARKRSGSSQDLLFFDSPHIDFYMLLFYDNVGMHY